MIRVVDLHKSFNGLKVLRGINLSIEKGKTTVILGGSGVGKTVFIKHLIGLMKPDKGSIYVDDVDITRLKEKELAEVRKKFGMLFQEAALFDSLTVGENVGFPLREHTKLSTEAIDKIVREKLEQVGLQGIEDKYPSELSGGMKRRVGLARAMALNPEILLFDEPTTGLDPIMKTIINDLIINTQRRGSLTCVVITHDITTTFKLAHKVAMIHEGIIVEEGLPEEFKNSSNLIVQAFLAGKPQE
ncbi:MAG TPA: ABC transporter ATP-binding protein [Syntrophaceae bacterium]|nr:ABC transporter ATP-binding protein [Syntrophaceae bacterium]